MLKRGFDILVSLADLIVFAVPMGIIAILIRRGSPGGAIFRQRRIGLDGNPFIMLKFRTMRIGADPYAKSPQSGQDPRLTRIGRFLRETSLDELPQLLNVLSGDMSIVGPRPLYEKQAERWNERQRRRLEVRPGLTGYAQAYGRGNMTHEQKLEIDVFYVENADFRLDMKIILRTFLQVFRRRDEVYEREGHNG
ncbi:MAG: sugar transferase [Phycisphaerae bacterium]|nr:sugar transferase [Phycisphaerae bacterium]